MASSSLLPVATNDSEVWRLATSMENHKSEIENWDLGAGIYISFYLMRSLLQDDNKTMSELNSLDSKNDACKDFLGRLNESLVVCCCKLRVEARVAYSKMAEEICKLLLSDICQGLTRGAQLSCFDKVFSTPTSKDFQASHLLDAIPLFTCSV